MIEDMQIRNLSERTRESYVDCVASFARYYGKSPEKLGWEEIRNYQLHLLQDKGFSPSYVNVHVCALKFLYRTTLRCDWRIDRVLFCKRETRLPVILSRNEVSRFLLSIENRMYQAILTTVYATGLRISEVTRLRVSDIDSERMTIRVNQGKGKKDRDVMLSPKLLHILREYWKQCRSKNIDPDTWLFPGRKTGNHITPGSVRSICHKVCLALSFKKLVNPHSLRHCFATHLLEDGVNLPTLQKLLGHRCLSSTLRYTHIAREDIQDTASPLDTLPNF
jgi:site-specific recombinase XerD